MVLSPPRHEDHPKESGPEAALEAWVCPGEDWPGGGAAAWIVVPG